MKKIIAFAFAVILLFTLAACSNKNTNSDANGETTVNGTVSAVTDEGFTLTTGDGTEIEFTQGPATRVLLEEFINGAQASVTYTGDAAAKDAASRTLLLVDKVA